MKSRLLLAAFLFLGGQLNAQVQELDTTTFVVVGGGLSAGFADSVLIGQSQKYSFPVLLAAQMKTLMPLPLFRDGGPVTVISFDKRAGALPRSNQSSLRSLPFPLLTFNLSVPFLKISESLNRPPALPLVREGDLKQSLINMILGYPALIFEDPPVWTQADYAEIVAPTFIIVEMGFGDVAEGALVGDAGLVTSVSSFGADYAKLAKRLKDTNATVLLMNIPDPTDAAYFFTLDQAARQYGTSTAALMARFGLQSSDLITLGGMVEVGERFSGRRDDPLSATSVVRSQEAARIRAAVLGMNSAIANEASTNGFKVFDLNAFAREVRSSGVQAGSRRLGGGYLEGYYSQDGLFPTPLGQAVLANRLLRFVNDSYRTNFPMVSLDTIPAQAGSGTPLKTGFESMGAMPRLPVR